MISALLGVGASGSLNWQWMTVSEFIHFCILIGKIHCDISETNIAAMWFHSMVGVVPQGLNQNGELILIIRVQPKHFNPGRN